MRRPPAFTVALLAPLALLAPVVVLAPSCGGGDGALPDAVTLFDAVATPDAAPAADIREQLEQVPGLTVEPGDTSLPGYRLYHLTYEQPVDHAAPGAGTFRQRLTLLHHDVDAPMVLVTEGYYVSTGDHRAEPTELLAANQLAVEHRFFEPSRPDPAAWDKLTIEQAAADHHRIVAAFASLYPGRWLSTGASKSGMTAVYHRRFYPDDVDGTVAYVAPNSLGAPDPRYPVFLAGVGEAACRDALAAFQRTVLERRAAMIAALRAWAAQQGAGFSILGEEMALEHAVLEMSFAFWQYGDASLCPLIPGGGASDDQVFDFLDGVVGVWFFSDEGVLAYQPYYYQAATQLGYPAYEETHLTDLLQYPGTYAPQPYAPAGVALDHDAGAMQDIATWVASEGRQLLFIYGGNDPWSAAAFDPGGAADSFAFVVPDGNHGASISDLPPQERQQALEAVRRWGGVSALRSRPAPPAARLPLRRAAPL